jgi:hypothetical protein
MCLYYSVEDGLTNQKKCSGPCGWFLGDGKPFCHAIGWRVIGSDGDVGNVKKSGKLGLRGGRKIGSHDQM